jgi:Predicted pPIWI-associating nuclease
MSRGSEQAQIELEILRIVAQRSPQAVERSNLLGNATRLGEIELARGTSFTESDRERAYRAFDRMRDAGWLRPTRTDPTVPDNWVVITDAGRNALKHGTLDDLDVELEKLDAHLIEVRRGIWSALDSCQPHALAQAAHSARELVDQVLKAGAPDDRVKAAPDFQPDVSSSSGITRRMRLKFLMRESKGEMSERDLVIAEKAADLVLAVDKKLMGEAHSRTENEYEQVKAAIVAAETALRAVLIPAEQSRDRVTGARA